MPTTTPLNLYQWCWIRIKIGFFIGCILFSNGGTQWYWWKKIKLKFHNFSSPLTKYQFIFSFFPEFETLTHFIFSQLENKIFFFGIIFKPIQQSRSKDFNQTEKNGEKFGHNFGFGFRSQSQFDFWFLKILSKTNVEYNTRRLVRQNQGVFELQKSTIYQKQCLEKG